MSEHLIAEIITIGNEVLAGRTLNTNAANISQMLDDIGVDVRWVTTCGDNRDDVTAAFRNAWDRAKIVIVTGGLGPTHDDITVKVFCEFFNRGIVRSEAVLRHLEDMFQRRGRELTERNRTQADVPTDTEVLMNNAGTAPGIYLNEQDHHWFLLPGVPREMKQLTEDEVLPHLKRIVGDGVVVRRDIHVIGWPESNLMDVILDVPHIESVASLPDERGEVVLRISVAGDTRTDAEQRVEEVRRCFNEKLGLDIYGVDDETLESVVGRLLREQRKTIAVAESVTSGLVGDRITDVPGSSDYFLGGIIAYSNDAKVELLDVPRELIRDYGAVSDQVARAMAEGARNRFGADIAVSLTGIAGPGGGSDEKPVGLVYIGLAWEGGAEANAYRLGDRRALVKQRAAQTALDVVRRHLLSASTNARL